MRPFDRNACRQEQCPKCRGNHDVAGVPTFRWTVRFIGALPEVVLQGKVRAEGRPEYLEVSCPKCGYVLTHMEPADADTYRAVAQAGDRLTL